MRPLLLIVFLSCTLSGFTQYYFRGELKDEHGQKIPGAKITLRSKGEYPFYTGSTGEFGIPVSVKVDTVTFTLDGYDTLKKGIVTTEYGSFVLKTLPRKSAVKAYHLSSVTKNLHPATIEATTEDGESYASIVENPFVQTKKYPETGFALHVDRASYSNIRRFIMSKKKPPTDAVRIEEMLNYFNLRSNIKINSQKTFALKTTLTSCPWNQQNRLLFINLQARKINLDKTPCANLVFLIDVSGSMDVENRLPLLKSAFKLLVENLRSEDIVSIVTYGDKVTIALQPTHGDNKQQIIEAIEGLDPAGATAGASAIRTAYQVARENFIPQGNNRVILATDGDFNIGQTSEKDLENIISQESKTGIYLTCLGVGIGNYKDSKLEALANKGNGNFAYLDTEKEAEKVLVEEFAQTMYTVAENVYLNLSFNPEAIKLHRLIGFDNKKTTLTDTVTAIEGGAIGSGHSLVAAFEITPADTPFSLERVTHIGTAELSYKIPGDYATITEKYKVPQNFVDISQADSCFRFATSVIMFGSILKASQFVKQVQWEEVHSLASNSANRHSRLQKEFVDLIGKAKKMYPQRKNRSSKF